MPRVGRKPVVRDTYAGDAQKILTLIQAVELDVGRPVEWREQMIRQLRVVASNLINAPESNV